MLIPTANNLCDRSCHPSGSKKCESININYNIEWDGSVKKLCHFQTLYPCTLEYFFLLPFVFLLYKETQEMQKLVKEAMNTGVKKQKSRVTFSILQKILSSRILNCGGKWYGKMLHFHLECERKDSTGIRMEEILKQENGTSKEKMRTFISLE